MYVPSKSILMLMETSKYVLYMEIKIQNLQLCVYKAKKQILLSSRNDYTDVSQVSSILSRVFQLFQLFVMKI